MVEAGAARKVHDRKLKTIGMSKGDQCHVGAGLNEKGTTNHCLSLYSLLMLSEGSARSLNHRWQVWRICLAKVRNDSINTIPTKLDWTIQNKPLKITNLAGLTFGDRKHLYNYNKSLTGSRCFGTREGTRLMWKSESCLQ